MADLLSWRRNISNIKLESTINVWHPWGKMVKYRNIRLYREWNHN